MPLKDPKARQAYHTQYMRERFQSDPVFKRKHLARVKVGKAKHQVLIDAVVAQFRKNGCLFCPEKEPCCLTAHHLEPNEKDFDVGGAGWKGYSVRRVEGELAKCICACFNCHAKIHAGIVLTPLQDGVEETLRSGAAW
jgi:hypothetical protein